MQEIEARLKKNHDPSADLSHPDMEVNSDCDLDDHSPEISAKWDGTLDGKSKSQDRYKEKDKHHIIEKVIDKVHTFSLTVILDK